jgi:hypothetical protein
MSTLFGGVVAFCAASGAMAQETTAQPPEQVQVYPGTSHAPPALGGAVGTVDSVSASSFAISTSAGRMATVEKVPSTRYWDGTSVTSASAITKGENVLVLGMVTFGTGTKGTTISPSQVIVQPPDGGGPATSSAAEFPFQQGSRFEKRNVGQVPGNYTEGAGTIVGGTEAIQATLAALSQKTGGIVNRVVKLSDGEYEAHNIGVKWPHHIFVNQDFQYVGAN